jgi:hypothetical protein
MPLDRLPGWVIDDATSVREEVAPYVGMSMNDRWAATRRCCAAAATLLRFNRDPRRALEYRDALPESTVEALRRLRQTRHSS